MDKTVFVTGASGQIGNAIAMRMGACGYRVVLHGRREEVLEELMNRMLAGGMKAAVVVGDFADRSTIERVLDQAISFWGGIDVLINNAGGPPPGKDDWSTIEPSSWQVAWEMNLLAPVKLAALVLPGMQKNRWGRIVQIGSGMAIDPMERGPAYAATKAALWNATLSLARVGGPGVTSNMVTPGAILTDKLRDQLPLVSIKREWNVSAHELEQKAIHEFAPNPQDRFGTVDEVASAVAFLVSEEASYINGVNLRVDGGLHAHL